MANGMLFISDCSDRFDQSDANGNPLSGKHSKVNLLTFPSIPNLANTMNTKMRIRFVEGFLQGF